MARWEKRLRDMAENPAGHTYNEACSVLEALQFQPPRKPKGSHRFWRHAGGCRVGLVDSGRGAMPVEYIKDMVQQLRAYGLFPSRGGS
jgi:predicted RNA binding protein YcfA (HicA-like mRNA interferase family)